MLTITHTHEEGTLVDGTSRGDGSNLILKRYGFRWSRNLGQWYLPRSRDRNAGAVDELRNVLHDAGFEVELSVDNTRRSVEEVQDARIEADEASAERNAARAASRSATASAEFEKSHAATAGIPFGQPILVGHHSEGRHRAALKRSDGALRRGVEASREAEGFEHRAASAEARVERRDDPAYVGNRLKDAEAGLRAAERGGGYGRHGDVERAQEELTYWQDQMDRIRAQGVKVFTRADLAVGDFVKTKGSWGVVAKLNPKTVAIDTGYMPWPLKYGYHEVKDHRPKAEPPETKAHQRFTTQEAK